MHGVAAEVLQEIGVLLQSCDRSIRPDTRSVALRLHHGVVTLGGVGFVSALANDAVERVLCGSGAGFACGTGRLARRRATAIATAIGRSGVGRLGRDEAGTVTELAWSVVRLALSLAESKRKRVWRSRISRSVVSVGDRSF